MNIMKMLTKAAAVMLMGASCASAATLYDGSAANAFMTSRSADFGVAGHFQVSGPVEVNQFDMGLDLDLSGNVNFIVFDGVSLIYQSGAVALTDIGFQRALSPIFSLNLLSGQDYYFGVITDVGSLFGCCGTGGTQGLFTSIASNSNPFSFANPVNDGFAGAHIDIKLYSADVAAVPLPAGGVLLISALGGAAIIRRRKSV